MVLLHLSNTASAVQYNTSAHLTWFRRLWIFHPLLYKKCLTSLLLKAKMFLLSRSFSSHATNNLINFVVSSFVNMYQVSTYTVVCKLLPATPISVVLLRLQLRGCTELHTLRQEVPQPSSHDVIMTSASLSKHLSTVHQRNPQELSPHI
jgi:hypothetical protein